MYTGSSFKSLPFQLIILTRDRTRQIESESRSRGMDSWALQFNEI